MRQGVVELQLTRSDSFRGSLPLLVCSFVIALATITGLYFDVSSPLSTTASVPATLLVSICLATIAASFTLLLLIRHWLATHELSGPKDAPSRSTGRVAACNAALILALWSPYLLLCYPGSVPYDGIYQLTMALGYQPLTSAHPVFSTLILGTLFRLGASVSDNFGVFLAVLTQSAFSAAVYGYVAAWVADRLTCRAVRPALIVYFGVLPQWGAWAQTFGKDTFYYAAFALFVLMVAQLLTEESRAVRWVSLVLSALLMCLFRKEAIAVVAISLAVIAFTNKSARKAAGSALAAIVCVYAIVGNVVVPRLYNEPAPNRFDALSLVFQQTARTVAAHGDELSEQDRAAIDAVLGIDDLAERYNPYCADPVKDRIPSTVTRAQVMDYLAVWLRELPTYYRTYASAFLQQSFGYLYPPFMYEGLDQYKFYIKGEPFNTGQLDLHYGNESAKSMVARGVASVSRLPILGLLDNCGTYGLLLLAACSLTLASGRGRLAAFFTPLLLCLAVCLVSPVNAYLRYALPNMAAMPVCLYVVAQAYVPTHGGPKHAQHAKR